MIIGQILSTRSIMIQLNMIKKINWHASQIGKINNQNFFTSYPISKLLFDTYDIDKIKKDMYWGVKIEELNSKGYRSDEFKTEHSGKHVLFSGCSYTFGSGVLLEEIWAKKVYNFINEKELCSGFFNLGVSASSIFNQISDIFKYCKTYGNPDAIFLNFPNLNRMYIYDITDQSFHEGDYDDSSLHIFKIIAYQQYMMLNHYCNVNNIKLYSFSWDNQNKRALKGFKESLTNLKTFYEYKNKDQAEHVLNFIDKNKNDKYAELARDNTHRGTAYHDHWANFIYEKYVNDNSRN
jgi:hypothetical protein